MARVGVERAEPDPDAAHLGGDRRGVGDGVALEVGVVDPHRLQAPVGGGRAPPDRVRDLAASRQPEPDAAGQLSHVPMVAPLSGGPYAGRRQR